MSVSAKRVPYFAAAVLLFATIMTVLLPARRTYAQTELTGRSLTLQDGTVAGSAPGDGNTADNVNHEFTFTFPNGETLKSIMFQYCTTADIDTGGTCTTPTGLITTSATLGSPSGGFDSLVANNGSGPGSAGEPYVTSAAGVTITANEKLQIQLSGVVNPDDTNCSGAASCTFFVHITTYTTTDATGTIQDEGTVAAATVQPIVLTGTMPESLIFCTGVTVASPNCTTVGSGDVTFSQLFSPTATVYTSSQMAASTNANNGYAITVSGPALTSGTSHIYGTDQSGNAAVSDTSTVGTSVFGMNLVADTNATGLTPASADITPASDGVNYWGTPHTNFDTDGSYAFTDTTTSSGYLNDIAGSDYGASGPTGTEGPTDGQIYTATYMVNVAANQPAGTYTSTLTYICTPTF